MRTIVQIVALDETGDSCYRMQWPAEALARLDQELCVINLPSNSCERYSLAEEADLLVLFNCCDPDLLTVIESRKKKGLKTLLELNDNFYESAPWFPVAKAWGSIHLHVQYERFMQVADAVMVTGDGLAQLFQEKTQRPIHIIKNNLPFKPDNLEHLVLAKEVATFGWAGSLGHMADILSIAPSIRQILRQNPDSRFHVMGNDALQTNLRIDQARLRYTPWGAMSEYFNFWKPIVAGIIPLIDTPYNQCRSDIKLIEMVAHGVVPIAPRLLPYQELIERFNLPSYHNQKSLIDCLSRVLEWSSEDRHHCLKEIFSYIANERVEGEVTQRLELYRSLLPQDQPSLAQSTLGAGYHVIKGPTSDKALYIDELQQIQNALNIDGQKLDWAIESLKSKVSASPFHAEYAIAYLKALKRLYPEQANLFLAETRQNFDRDIRFDLIRISLASTSELPTLWKELLNRVTGESLAYQKNAREVLKRPMLEALEKYPQEMGPIIEQFLKLFPNQQQVRLALATSYEKQDLIHDAHRHFSLLREAKQALEEGGAELAPVELGYLAAWEEALNKRLSLLNQ